MRRVGGSKSHSLLACRHRAGRARSSLIGLSSLNARPFCPFFERGHGGNLLQIVAAGHESHDGDGAKEDGDAVKAATDRVPRGRQDDR